MNASARQRDEDRVEENVRAKSLGVALGFCPQCETEFLAGRAHDRDCTVADDPRYEPRDVPPETLVLRPAPSAVTVGKSVHLRCGSEHKTLCGKDAWRSTPTREAVTCRQCRKAAPR